MIPTPLYDSLSSDYDRFVNWPSRLAFEMPFIESQLVSLPQPSGRPLRILDAATGTGMHVLELAHRGYTADGADISQGMVDQARQNVAIGRSRTTFVRLPANNRSAPEAGLPSPQFRVAGFGSLANAFSDTLPYDAVLCLGNSLPHLLSLTEVESALADFTACLHPGGLLIIQNRNFDAVMLKRERWMDPQSYQDLDETGAPREWLFLRFYDFLPNRLIEFHVLTLKRQGAGTWQQKIDSTHLYPLQSPELHKALHDSGFETVTLYGGMNASPFDPLTSPNLVLTARLPL
jgi:glycine/sarcosine N-methyltransferase